MSANGMQSTMCCSAATAAGLVSRGVKFFACGEPLISTPPEFAKRVYQSTRNIETSPDLAIMLFPETPLPCSFSAAARYWPQVFGTDTPAALSRSLR